MKSGLLAVLIALGYANRRRLRRPVVLAEIAVLAVLLLAVGVLTGSRPGRAPAGRGRRRPPTGPIALPPRGVLTLAAQNVRNAVTIAVRPAGGQTEVTATVHRPGRARGERAPGADQRRERGRLWPRAATGRSSRAVPLAARIDAGTGTVVFPLRTVPGPGAALVARAGR